MKRDGKLRHKLRGNVMYLSHEAYSKIKNQYHIQTAATEGSNGT
jgi:RecA-family ATPase